MGRHTNTARPYTHSPHRHTWATPKAKPGAIKRKPVRRVRPSVSSLARWGWQRVAHRQTVKRYCGQSSRSTTWSELIDSVVQSTAGSNFINYTLISPEDLMADCNLTEAHDNPGVCALSKSITSAWSTQLVAERQRLALRSKPGPKRKAVSAGCAACMGAHRAHTCV